MKNEAVAEHKSLKIILIVAAVLVIIAAGILIGINIYTSVPHYEPLNKTIGLAASSDSLSDENYHVSLPTFAGALDWSDAKFVKAYEFIDEAYTPYAYEILDTYGNYAVLDYTVDIGGNSSGKKLLTVSFTGFGYPDEGKGDPVSLDREYVFDITNVNSESLPVLLGVS